MEQQSQLVKSTLIKAKADYANKLVDLIKTDPKKFYNYARHYFRSSSTVESLQINESVVKDDVGKANILNEFFCILKNLKQIICQS